MSRLNDLNFDNFSFTGYTSSIYNLLNLKEIKDLIFLAKNSDKFSSKILNRIFTTASDIEAVALLLVLIKSGRQDMAGFASMKLADSASPLIAVVALSYLLNNQI